MSDNRELYIHLDTMTPLRLEENSLSRSQLETREEEGPREEPQHFVDYDYHDYFDILYSTESTTVKTRTTATNTHSSLPPSVFFTTLSTKTVSSPRTIPTVKIRTSTKSPTAGRYPLFYEDKDEVSDSDVDIIVTEDEIGNSTEILRNLSLNLADPRPANTSGSGLLVCQASKMVCTAVNVLVFVMLVMIVIIVLGLYFEFTPRKCAERLQNSDRVIL